MSTPRPPGPPPDSYYVGAPVPDSTARSWAMACHLLGLVGFLGPLILWLVKKDAHPFVDDQGKEALNFQLSVLIYSFISAFLVFLFIGMLLLPALWIFDLVCIILGAVRANSGVAYRYPLCLRLIR